MKKNVIELYFAAIGGAFLLIIADLMANLGAATTLKLGTIMNKFVFKQELIDAGYIGLILVIVISIFICWLFSPKDKVAAFTRGLSIFAVLSAITPYSIAESTTGTDQPGSKPPIQSKIEIYSPSISVAYADDEQKGLKCRPGRLLPDSTLISNKYVSSCKPYYSGFLGIGSFFNNTIEYCKSQHTLPKGERVKYLQSWETALRGYRYTEIEFEVDGQICTGWVSDGRKSVRHIIRD
jgi:hypothetical protein